MTKALPLQNSDATGPRSPTRKLFTTPTGWLFLLLASCVLYYLATADRPSTLPDQANYVTYFEITNWQWVVDYFSQSTSALNLAIGLVTDELGWRTWIILVNSLGVSPETGVRITVVFLNALVFYTLSRLSRPLLGLLLWLVIPSALAIVGLFQIRQGFAFAVAMLMAISFKRPILGALLASSIHTTFAVPAILLIVTRMSGPKLKIALPAASVSAILVAMAGRVLFQDYGGRRIAEYAGYEAGFTIRLLILMITYGIASAMVLYQMPTEDKTSQPPSLRELAIMHIALIVYLAAAFLVFPFGKDRVFYYVSLLLPYFAQEIKVRNPVSLWMLLVLYLMIAAEVALEEAKGLYVYLLQ